MLDVNGVIVTRGKPVRGVSTCYQSRAYLTRLRRRSEDSDFHVDADQSAVTDTIMKAFRLLTDWIEPNHVVAQFRAYDESGDRTSHTTTVRGFDRPANQIPPDVDDTSVALGKRAQGLEDHIRDLLSSANPDGSHFRWSQLEIPSARFNVDRPDAGTETYRMVNLEDLTYKQVPLVCLDPPMVDEFEEPVKILFDAESYGPRSLEILLLKYWSCYAAANSPGERHILTYFDDLVQDDANWELIEHTFGPDYFQAGGSNPVFPPELVTTELPKSEIITAAISNFREDMNRRFIWPETGETIEVEEDKALGVLTVRTKTKQLYRARFTSEQHR